MTDEALAKRSPREYLSKSFLTGVPYCGMSSWFDIWEPRPWVPDEAMVFGSAVDAGVEAYIGYRRSDQPVDMDTVHAAAAKVVLDEGIEVDTDGVRDALEAFAGVPFDWAFCKTQHHIRIEVDGVGKVDAHPDIILRDNEIWDIKTAKKSKPKDAAEKSYRELGFYAMLHELATGETVPGVGYLTWVRTSKPYWQDVYAPVTDEMRRKSLYIARQVASAITRSTPDFNDTFTNGPLWPGKCMTCRYAPVNGGRCEIVEAPREGTA